MDAGLLDVLHDAADHHAGGGVAAVGNAIDIDLDRVVKEAVQQYRRLLTDLDRFTHVALEILVAVHDLHRTTAQHIARAHHQRIADLVRQGQCLLLGTRGPVRRLLQTEFVQQLLEALAVFGHVDAVGRGADDRYARTLQVERQLQRRLPAVLHDHTNRFFLGDDLEHVFQCHRLEVEPIRGVVVGRYGFRVAVDHDGLVSILAHRQCRMHAAVVELDALADTVRPAAEHHDLLAVGRLSLALFVVGRIQVGGLCCEFRCAGVDALEHRAHIRCPAGFAHQMLVRAQQLGESAVRKALLLQVTQFVFRQAVQRAAGERLLGLDQLLDLREEPRVDRGFLEDFLQTHADAERIADIEDALRPGLADLLDDFVAVGAAFAQAVDASLESAQRLLEAFLEGAAHRHHLADRLHLRRQV